MKNINCKYTLLKLSIHSSRAPENAGMWAHVTRNIRDMADISNFYIVFCILSAKSAQAQNQLLGHFKCLINNWLGKNNFCFSQP